MARVLAALCVLALVSTRASAERIWAEVSSPTPSQLVREPFGLVEVRGWAGTGLRGEHDVVLAIDRTPSTFLPSGADVDGDGKVGVIVRVPGVAGQTIKVMSDPDDTIAAAELLAARRLIERLDPATTRMGIVTFGRTERVLARIGTSPEELLGVIDRLPPRPEAAGTYFYGAIIASLKVFEQAPPDAGSEPRIKSIIFLSDGLPNRPAPPASAEKAAVRASQPAANARVRIYSFALGPEVASRPKVFLRMAEVNGGDLLIVENPAEIIDFVPHMSLTRLREIKIDNLSASRPARAVRLFPDGTFDGFAPLVPGVNHLRITIVGEAGGTHVVDREVFFEKTLGTSPKERARLEALLKDLRIRTLETQLAEQARRRREFILERTLEIEIEAD